MIHIAQPTETFDDYIVLDIETTGLSKYTDGITELAGVRVQNDHIADEFQTLVNPQRHIPSFITRLTGIDDEMVKDAPKISRALPDFLDFIGNSTIIAHNATFDHGFLRENARSRLDIDWNNDRLCTRKLANRLLPDLFSKKLCHVCDHFEVVNTQAHRAMADVLATEQVFSKMLGMLHNAEIRRTDDIFRFESASRAQCARMLQPRDDV